MNKGMKGIILLFSIIGIGMIVTIPSAPLVFAQQAVEEKQPVAEFLGVE